MGCQGSSLNVFALILLCTKVSVLGILVVFVYTMFAFFFISFIQKKHIMLKNYIPARDNIISLWIAITY